MTTSITIRLSPFLHKEFKAYCANKQITMKETMTLFIEGLMLNQKKKNAK